MTRKTSLITLRFKPFGAQQCAPSLRTNYVSRKIQCHLDGLQQAYGTFKIEKQTQSGKNAGKAAVIREPRTTALWEGHLSGEGKGIGIIPINEDNNVKGAVLTSTSTR